MRNEIQLTGVLKNIEFSHAIDNVEFSKAQLIVNRRNGEQDVIDLKFKTYSNRYKENDTIDVRGNVRSYSHLVGEHNKVDVYVFTYFDTPEDHDPEQVNKVVLEGRICKMNPLRTTKNKRNNVHFILANNLEVKDSGRRLNSYLPCIAWGSAARELAKLPVNTQLRIEGELHSREHTKSYEDGSVEIRVAHEITISSFEAL